jgi:hypothetical protein
MPGGPPPIPAQAPLDTLAIVGFVLAFCCPPASIVCSAIALGRTGPGKNRGKGLAVAGLVIGVLALLASVPIVIVAIRSEADRDTTGRITREGSVAVDDIRAGDCMAAAPPETATTRVDLVPCTSSHRTQAYATFELPDGSFPGLTQVQEDAEAGCQERLTAAESARVDVGELSVSYYYPQSTSWNLGDRTVACLVNGEDGPLTEVFPVR